ncbi:MAG: RNase H-like domain-containing protein [Plesiomonas shigelloides]
MKKAPTHLTLSPEAITVFQHLKQSFTSAPILHRPDPEQPFIVEVDASSTGIGLPCSCGPARPPNCRP